MTDWGMMRRAFTLLELLVVIAIVGILMALLAPALAGGKERARRAACKGHLRQFLLAIHLYADEHEGLLPSGLSDNSNPLDEHIPVVATATRAALITYTGNRRMLECPSLGAPFNSEGGWHYENYGFVLGYNYHGGHQNTPWPDYMGFVGWRSPQRINDEPTTVLLSDLNDWSPGYQMSFAPHSERGPVAQGNEFNNPAALGASSPEIGAVGGHTGLLDGSVHWKTIDQMNRYRGSLLWDESGCFAMW